MINTTSELGVAARMRPVIDRVAKAYGITREQLLSGGTYEIIEAKSLCVWLAREIELPLSGDQLRSVLGYTSRSLVRQAMHRITERRRVDRTLLETSDRLVEELRA